MEDMKIVECNVDGKLVKIEVKKTIPYIKRVAASNVIAEAIMSENGEYHPWAFDIHFTIFILSAYTDFIFPESWDDNEVYKFSRSAQFEVIFETINDNERKEVCEWVEKLVEYRKKCFEKNAVSRLLDTAKEFFKVFQEMLLNNPDILDAFGSLPELKNLQ